MSPHSQSVLLVQSPASNYASLVPLFEGAGIVVHKVEKPQQVQRFVNGHRPSVIIFDTTSPLASILSTIQLLHASCDCGVIVLCSHADPVDCILGLEMGADDVIPRERDPREIVARARRLMTRANELREETTGRGHIVFSSWKLDLDRRELTHSDGRRVHLTRGEFDLLAALASHDGKVMERDQLLDHISQREWAPSDRTVDVLINRLRHKIGEDPREPRHLVTVHGVGYVFNP